MKKMIFAVATALVMSLAFTSCGSKSKADQMIDDMEALVEKAEKVKDNPTEALGLLKEFADLGEKYKDVDEKEFTPEQKKKIEELGNKLGSIFE